MRYMLQQNMLVYQHIFSGTFCAHNAFPVLGGHVKSFDPSFITYHIRYIIAIDINTKFFSMQELNNSFQKRYIFQNNGKQLWKYFVSCHTTCCCLIDLDVWPCVLTVTSQWCNQLNLYSTGSNTFS